MSERPILDNHAIGCLGIAEELNSCGAHWLHDAVLSAQQGSNDFYKISTNNRSLNAANQIPEFVLIADKESAGTEPTPFLGQGVINAMLARESGTSAAAPNNDEFLKLKPAGLDLFKPLFENK